MSLLTGAPRSPGAPVCPADPYKHKEYKGRITLQLRDDFGFQARLYYPL
jgi:hypothetical protein